MEENAKTTTWDIWENLSPLSSKSRLCSTRPSLRTSDMEERTFPKNKSGKCWSLPMLTTLSTLSRRYNFWKLKQFALGSKNSCRRSRSSTFRWSETEDSHSKSPSPRPENPSPWWSYFCSWCWKWESCSTGAGKCKISSTSNTLNQRSPKREPLS